MKKINLPGSQSERREYSYSFQRDEKKLSSDFSVKYEYHSEKRLVNITRSNYLVYDENPDDTLIGNLVFQASEALFPLILQINSSGYPTGIFNHSEILERWKSFTPRFQEYYDNPLSVNLLNRIGKLCKDPEKLLAGLQNDWLYASFFFPVYGEYSENEIVVLDYPFPSVIRQATYKTELSLSPEKTDQGKTEILLSEKSSANENNKVEGRFLLNSDRSIHWIDLNFSRSDIGQHTNILIRETKEIKERKTEINLTHDEKAEHEKRNGKGFFIEEVGNNGILPRHK